MEKPGRNLSVDTYRGFVMLLMMAEVVQLANVAKALPGNAFWSFQISTHFTLETLESLERCLRSDCMH